MCESSETNESKLREMKMSNLLTERKDKTKNALFQQILQFTSFFINLVFFFFFIKELLVKNIWQLFNLRCGKFYMLRCSDELDLGET